jgi:CheY-like chemotaxis protein
MDMGLVDIQGAEISDKLKTMLNSVDLSIALIRMGKNADLKQSEELGFTQSLTKPVKQSVLKDLVRNRFGSSNRTKADSQTANKTVPSFSKTRILLVEDNPINARIGSEMLCMAGVEVDTAQNGLEAIEKVKENKYDAVLIDIQMPPLDGIEASRIIRRQFSSSRLPIIAMSAHAKADNWKACLEAEINDYILKPVNRNVLFTVLKNQIRPGHNLPCPKSDKGSRKTIIQVNADMQNLPGLDIKQGLERLGGETLIYAEILSDFCQTYAGFQQEMKELISCAKFNDAADLSHSFKGASGNVSAMPLFESVKKLEQACRQKKGQAAQLLLESVQSEYKTVCQSAGQFCEQIGSNKTVKETGHSSEPLVDASDRGMDALAKLLKDSLDQCDPVLSETLVREMALQIPKTWKKEMDHLIDAVKKYQFDDAMKWLTILMEKTGI